MEVSFPLSYYPRCSLGGGATVGFHHQFGAYDTQTLIGALGQLRRALGGQKATLVWDGLPAHRSRAMAAWLRSQRSWLVTERLPGYAPELNPEVTAAAERGVQRIRATHWLGYSFLRHCGLSLW